MSAFIHTFPGESFSLRWREGKGASHAALADVAFDAIHRMSSFMEPLTLEIACGCYSRQDRAFAMDGDPRRSGYLAVHTALPDDVDVEATYIGTERIEASSIDRSTLKRILARLADDSCHAEDLEPAWKEMVVDVVAARVVNVADIDAPDFLELEAKHGTHFVPVLWRDGLPWVIGPRGDVIEAPFRIHVLRSWGEILFDMSVRWSLWTQPGSSGRRLVDDYIADLELAGWVQR